MPRESCYSLIAGVDEVGRGPLAGPVVAAVAVFRRGYKNSDFQDSKQLSAKTREALVPIIKREAVAWAIVSVGHHRILRHNIREASRLAMSLAVRRIRADFVLVDGNVPIWTDTPQRTVIKGDALHVEISAASILAKVYRDNLMVVLDKKYPGYGLNLHAGYPTEYHRNAIAKIGPCPIHRAGFSGVREFLQFTVPEFQQKQRQRIGRRGETFAARLLESRGCHVLVKNWKVKFGEIDFVAIDGRTLVIVEVKTRVAKYSKSGVVRETQPERAVSAKKRQKLRLLSNVAARRLRKYMRKYRLSRMRIDVVAITLRRNRLSILYAHQVDYYRDFLAFTEVGRG